MSCTMDENSPKKRGSGSRCASRHRSNSQGDDLRSSLIRSNSKGSSRRTSFGDNAAQQRRPRSFREDAESSFTKRGSGRRASRRRSSQKAANMIDADIFAYFDNNSSDEDEEGSALDKEERDLPSWNQEKGSSSMATGSQVATKYQQSSSNQVADDLGVSSTLIHEIAAFDEKRPSLLSSSSSLLSSSSSLYGGAEPPPLSDESLSSVIDPMHRDPLDEAAHERACAAVSHWARIGGHERRILAESNGIDTVLRAMKRHPKSVAVQVAGCRALGDLCLRSDGGVGGDGGIINSVLWHHHGAVYVVLDAMRAHPATSAVYCTGCYALEKSFANKNNLSAVFEDDGCDGLNVIVRGMQAHAGDAEAQDFGRRALRHSNSCAGIKMEQNFHNEVVGEMLCAWKNEGIGEDGEEGEDEVLCSWQNAKHVDVSNAGRSSSLGLRGVFSADNKDHRPTLMPSGGTRHLVHNTKSSQIA